MDKSVSLKFNVPILKLEKLKCDFNKPYIRNDSFPLYEGTYDGLGSVTCLTLHNIEDNIDTFYKASTQINIFVNLNLSYMAKLYGIIPDNINNDRFILIFEHITDSLSEKLEKKLLSDKQKFNIILEVMELILALHENKLSALDLRPSNIFFNNNKELKMIFPIENISVLKAIGEGAEEDEIIHQMINQEDILLRYSLDKYNSV